MNIIATWDETFSTDEQSMFLRAGQVVLGYVMRLDDGGYVACLGAGIDAPMLGGGTLDACKQAIEEKYKNET